VPFSKKDARVRMYMDFGDLNKVSPKDDFPLPHIDGLLDKTASHPLIFVLWMGMSVITKLK